MTRYTRTATGQIISLDRQTRKLMQRTTGATSGRQWRKTRKQLRREQRQERAS